jgi:proline dehydrogenase
MALVGCRPHARAALLRLVDVAPACQGPLELAEHLLAFADVAPEAERVTGLMCRLASSQLSGRAIGTIVGRTIRQMARRFIVGESPAEAATTLRGLWERGTAVSVDLLGEATVTRTEGRDYADRCDDALATLAAESAAWAEQPLLERDAAGTLPRVNLSVKVTALTPMVRTDAPERGVEDAGPHLRRLLRRAQKVGAHLHIDMESMASRELVLALVLDILNEPEFASGPSAGIVLQAYLRDCEDTLDRILEWARVTGRSTPLTIRLVKGAYWDHELIEAAQYGWVAPVWTEKADSDRCFERVTRRLIDAYPLVRPAIASHNLRSIGHAVAYARRLGLAPADLELQVIRGLGDGLQNALRAEGLRCRTYCPVGDMVAGMAYLVRRLLENSANDSFLALRTGGVDLGLLLRRP